MSIRLFSILLSSFISGHLMASPPPSLHEFHVSKCVIEYKDNMLQISMHLFIDDLEKALEEQGVTKQYIGTEREASTADELIARYIQQRFSIDVNETDLSYQFLGKELTEDLTAIWCYMEVSNLEELQHLRIANSVLMEIYDDQKNLTTIYGPNKKMKSFLFMKGNSKDELSF